MILPVIKKIRQRKSMTTADQAAASGTIISQNTHITRAYFYFNNQIKGEFP